MIRRSQRGRLKVYLGFAPGVGKTYLMLQEGHRLKAEGVDLVVGVVEDHGRIETRSLIDGLERIPMRKVEYHGITVEEMDVDAILERKPQVVLVDELAHTNVPGSRNSKRYEDVRDLVAAGIHVISTMNVQHLESLYDTVEKLVNVKVRERVPDAVLAEADQVVNVDLAAEDLQKRLREGKVYPKERVAASLDNFFTESNLEHLRELTLRELASQLDLRRREIRPENAAPGSPNGDAATTTDQVMVCLSSRGPNSAKLLRVGSRLAGKLNRNWYAVYVQTPTEEPTVIDATTQRLLGDTLTLANQLGATVFTFKGTDIADTILRFAEEYRVNQIVIGSPHPIPWWKRVLLGKRSVAEDLIMRQKNVTVIVVDADTPDIEPSRATFESEPKAASIAAKVDANSKPKPNGTKFAGIQSILDPSAVLLFDEPIKRSDLLEKLVTSAISHLEVRPSVQSVLDLLEQREARGSTFLNDGVALPHARIPGLSAPVAALAVTRAGVLDAPTSSPVDVVFLLLAPGDDPGAHLRALAAAGRLLSDRERRRELLRAPTPETAFNVLVGK